MSHIQSIISFIQNNYTPVMASIGRLNSRSYEFLQCHPKCATATIFSVNLLFITVIYGVPSGINQDINKRKPNLDAEQLTPVHGVLGVLTGGITFVFNMRLSKATGYKMSLCTQIFISSISMVYVHWKLQGLAKANDKNAAEKRSAQVQKEKAGSNESKETEKKF